MNKEELVELLAKSQEAIVLTRNYKSSRDLFLKINRSALSSVVKESKKIFSFGGKRVGNEKQFKFNQSMEARFDPAISAIEKKKLDKAKKEQTDRCAYYWCRWQDSLFAKQS